MTVLLSRDRSKWLKAWMNPVASEQSSLKFLWEVPYIHHHAVFSMRTMGSTVHTPSCRIQYAYYGKYRTYVHHHAVFSIRTMGSTVRTPTCRIQYAYVPTIRASQVACSFSVETPVWFVLKIRRAAYRIRGWGWGGSSNTLRECIGVQKLGGYYR